MENKERKAVCRHAPDAAHGPQGGKKLLVTAAHSHPHHFQKVADFAGLRVGWELQDVAMDGSPEKTQQPLKILPQLFLPINHFVQRI